jgi:long-chain acyl-CoA synthetase
MREKVDGVWLETRYDELDRIVGRLAAGLAARGVGPGDRVALFSANRPLWTQIDLAVQSLRAVTVPVYATSTAEQLGYILQDSGAVLVFTGSAQETGIACEAVAGDFPIVALHDDAGPDPRVIPLADLLAAGDADGMAERAAGHGNDASTADLATIIYTSGTTGEPKGVQLSHANILSQFGTLDSRFDVGPDDRSLCFLPLSHVYERAWSSYVYYKGACNSFVADPKQVIAYLAEVRPTAMVSAPRLYEKIYAAVLDKVEHAPPLRRRLFHWAIGVGERYQTAIRAGGADRPLRLKHGLADRLVLRKVRDLVGGPKNFFSSGGAPLAREIEVFFLSVGLLICQGYGLTESSPMLTCNSPADFRFGTVGHPIDGVEIRIDEGGEILARGPGIMLGYHGKPEETAETLRDGWLHTGDIGYLDDDGYLVITDRIKDIIVTSGGKNVAPQRIETIVGKDHYIDQMAVVGDKRQFLSALVVPSFESLKEWAAEKRIQFHDEDDLIRKPEVVKFIEERIRAHSVSLAPFETIKRFTLLARQFSMQAGEITPTLKVRRKVVMEKYRDLIDRMYM